MQSPFHKPRRTLRLWGKGSDMSALAAGLSGLSVGVALATSLPDVQRQPNRYAAQLVLAVVFVLIGVWLCFRSRFRAVAAVDEEAAWNATYDRLRNETDRFLASVVLHGYEATLRRYPSAPEAWQDLASAVPLPSVDERGPLRRWHSYLAEHPDERIRMMMFFADYCDAEFYGGEYRRLAVRTYDVFARSRGTKAGFAEWMEEELVRSGAEVLVVLLAYMEVARAYRVGGAPKPSHAGFWTLAEEWHPNHMRLPRARQEG